MIDTPTRRDITDAFDKAKSKSADMVDAARDSAERARDVATSSVSRALDEGKEYAQASAAALAKVAQERVEDYSDKWADTDPVGEAKDLAAKAASRLGGALSGVGKAVADNAAHAGDKLGDAYAQVARGVASSIHETAAQLDSGDLEGLGTAIKKFIRKNPGLTLGVAALAGYLAYRRLKRVEPELEATDEKAKTA